MMNIFKTYLQLFIHSPTGSIITMSDVDPTTFIYDLKSKVELETGILAELQNMFLNNLKLDDGKTFDEMNVKNGSFIRLKLKESSLQQIYLSAINGNMKAIFMLGVQLIQVDEVNDHLDNQLEQIHAWNIFAPLRAFQALFAASFSGHVKLITQLLSKSAAHIHMVTKNGRSLLHAASSQGHSNCANFLLAQGVDVKVTDNQGMLLFNL